MRGWLNRVSGGTPLRQFVGCEERLPAHNRSHVARKQAAEGEGPRTLISVSEVWVYGPRMYPHFKQSYLT